MKPELDFAFDRREVDDGVLVIARADSAYGRMFKEPLISQTTLDSRLVDTVADKNELFTQTESMLVEAAMRIFENADESVYVDT